MGAAHGTVFPGIRRLRISLAQRGSANPGADDRPETRPCELEWSDARRVRHRRRCSRARPRCLQMTGPACWIARLRTTEFLMRLLRPALLFVCLSSPVAHAAEIRVLSPGVVFNAGLLDLASEFGTETGVKVLVLPDLMGRI